MSRSFMFMGAADEENQNPTTKKSSKAMETTHNKKPRQRGMGVEKLERLRIEEKWKEINNINNNNITTPLFSSLPYGFMPPSTASFPNVSGGGGGGGLNLISPVGFSNSQNVVGCTSGGGAFFPSTQGLVLQHQLHSASNFSWEGAKVVAFHMKENTSGYGGGGGNLLMEYDFFPSSRTHNESDDAIGCLSASSASASASCVTTITAAEDDASTFIDLSLKLSY